MKLIIALLALSHAFASDIVCKTYYQVDTDMNLEATLSMSVTKLSEAEYQISNREIDFIVDPNPEYNWYEFHGVGNEITNLTDYKPRKYKDHVKFSFDSGLIGSGDQDWFYGSLDLLMPKKALSNLKSGEEFKAVIIMTYISDHWGGSRTLNCQIK